MIGRVALCPRWVPNAADPLTSHASADPPAYMVEYGAAHLVLSFGSEELPGEARRVQMAGRPTVVLFNPPDSGAPGLHSGHYLIELSSPVDQRGTYSVSLHGDPNKTKVQNVSTLIRVARALTPVSQYL